MRHKSLMENVDAILATLRALLDERGQQHAPDFDALAVFKRAEAWDMTPLELCKSCIALKTGRLATKMEPDSIYDLMGYCVLYLVMEGVGLE